VTVTLVGHQVAIARSSGRIVEVNTFEEDVTVVTVAWIRAEKFCVIHARARNLEIQLNYGKDENGPDLFIYLNIQSVPRSKHNSLRL
jgi:hypothetical protein